MLHAFLRRDERPLGAAARGDVGGDHELGPPPRVFEFARADLDFEQRTILAAVAPHAGALAGSLGGSPQLTEHRRHVLRRTNVENGHAQEFFARVTVRVDGRVVHSEKVEGLEIVDPRRVWTRLEQRAVARVRRLEHLRALAQIVANVIDVLGHAVERAGDGAELVVADHVDARAVIPVADRVRRDGQPVEWSRGDTAHLPRAHDGDDRHERVHEQQEREHIVGLRQHLPHRKRDDDRPRCFWNRRDAGEHLARLRVAVLSDSGRPAHGGRRRSHGRDEIRPWVAVAVAQQDQRPGSDQLGERLRLRSRRNAPPHDRKPARHTADGDGRDARNLELAPLDGDRADGRAVRAASFIHEEPADFPRERR